MAAHAVWRYLLTTASYARPDLVAPVLRRRPRPTIDGGAKSFPVVPAGRAGDLAARRRIRRRAVVGDGELLAWAVRR